MCAHDRGALWGRDPCGPLLLVSPATRALVANQNTPMGSLRREGGVFVGTLPATVPIANTATALGRTLMRMEWRALAVALRARKADRRRAIRDALSFRAWRRQLAPDAAASENALELTEGMAEYTGKRLSGVSAAAVAAALSRAEHEPSFVRTSAYASGPHMVSCWTSTGTPGAGT